MCFMSYADTVWIRFTFGKGVFWSPPNCFRSKMNRLLFLSLVLNVEAGLTLLL